MHISGYQKMLKKALRRIDKRIKHEAEQARIWLDIHLDELANDFYSADSMRKHELHRAKEYALSYAANMLEECMPKTRAGLQPGRHTDMKDETYAGYI